MARNGSGTMSVLNTFVSNTTISSSAVNGNFTDVASEITNSLPRDGQAGMTGQFKAAAGTEAEPGIAFSVDTNLGIRRVGTDHMALVTGGNDRLEIDSVGNSIINGVLCAVGGIAIGTASVAVTTAGVDMITAASAGAQAILLGLNASFMSSMVGVVMDFAAATAPTGWLLAYGQAVSRSTYSALFGVIGTTYGAGNGTTTFNLPDLRGRVVAGKDNMGGSSADRLTDQSGGLDGDTLGDTGGSETHALTEGQLASHYHLVGSANGSVVTLAADNYPSDSRTIGGDANYTLVGRDVAPDRGRSASTGSGTAHNNVQPTIILSKIIFTGVFA